MLTVAQRAVARRLVGGEDLEPPVWDSYGGRHTTGCEVELRFEASDSCGEVEAYSVYNGALAFADLAPSEQNKDYLYTEDGALSWVTFNFKMSYQPAERIKLFGGVENILDTNYRPYSSGLSAPGRNYILSAKFSF